MVPSGYLPYPYRDGSKVFPISTAKGVYVTVDCKVHLGTLDGNTGISLTEDEFQELYEKRSDITTFLESESTQPNRWFFEGTETKRVDMCVYLNRRIINIREMIRGTGTNYGSLYPTRTGFAVSIRSWMSLLERYEEVKTYLNETKRVYAKVKGMVVKQLSDGISEKCNGCLIDHPSQLQHECLTLDWNSRVEDHFLAVMNSFNYSGIHAEIIHNSFLGVDVCVHILSHIACNAKSMLFKTEETS